MKSAGYLRVSFTPCQYLVVPLRAFKSVYADKPKKTGIGSIPGNGVLPN